MGGGLCGPAAPVCGFALPGAHRLMRPGARRPALPQLCFAPAPRFAASAVLDLGYTATVGLVAAAAGADAPAGAAVHFLVHAEPGSARDNAAGPAPQGEPLLLRPGGWAAQAWNHTGRQGRLASASILSGCTAVLQHAAGLPLHCVTCLPCPAPGGIFAFPAPLTGWPPPREHQRLPMLART